MGFEPTYTLSGITGIPEGESRSAVISMLLAVSFSGRHADGSRSGHRQSRLKSPGRAMMILPVPASGRKRIVLLLLIALACSACYVGTHYQGWQYRGGRFTNHGLLNRPRYVAQFPEISTNRPGMWACAPCGYRFGSVRSIRRRCRYAFSPRCTAVGGSCREIAG